MKPKLKCCPKNYQWKGSINMENVKELLEIFKNEIINELPKAIVNVMEMEISFEDESD